tara:strand:- start:399 stop:707 length:309 start_codon:yes stop_codon:yes gene_type:complete
MSTKLNTELNTPTPRTDAVQFKDQSDYHDPSSVDWFVRAEFARTLERELAAEREKSERYRLASLKLDADLATEQARLDYLLRWDPTFNSREDIDRDMQEATK